MYAEAMTRRSTDADLTPHERDVLQRLELTGWFVNIIAEDERGPGFAYSFGLYERFQHPEIILFGLGGKVMHELINEIGEAVKRGHRYGEGDETSDLLAGGYPCRFKQVNPRWYPETLTWTSWFYRSTDFPALQLFWPDKQNRFPWEKGVTDSFKAAQPDLSQPPVSG